MIGNGWKILLMRLTGGSGDGAVLMGCCTAFRNKAVLGGCAGKGYTAFGNETVSEAVLWG